MSELPSFELFPDPVGDGVFERSAEKCSLCKTSRGWIYTGPLFGEEDGDGVDVCPWCIADGTANRAGWFFVGDTLGDQPVSDADEALLQRTPGFTTWQDPMWLTCCGKACVFLGRAGEEELRGKWAESVDSIFEDFEYEDDERDEMLSEFSRDGSPVGYVFQCRVCKKLTGYQDAD